MRVCKLTSISSHNGLPPAQPQAIIEPMLWYCLLEPWGANFSEVFIEIYTLSLKKMH